MTYIGIVRGSETQAKPLVIGKDIVYIHKNISQITEPDERGIVPPDLYEYEELQYDKDEFLDLTIAENAKNSEAIDQIIITMLED